MRRADNLTTFMFRLSENLGVSTSCKPRGLSRPVQGLVYLYLHWVNRKECFIKNKTVNCVNTGFLPIEK